MESKPDTTDTATRAVDGLPVTTNEKPFVPTIWGVSCPFNKKGFPVVGSFGSSIKSVVIIPASTWSEICRRHPSLAKQEFNVGSYYD